MKEYIIIETWNGEGYSDSKAKLATIYNPAHRVLSDALEEARAYRNNTYSVKTEFDGKSHKAIYITPDREGAFASIEYNGEYGVIITPDTNDYILAPTKKEYLRMLTMDIARGGDVDDLYNSEGCMHTDDGCVIYQRLGAQATIEDCHQPLFDEVAVAARDLLNAIHEGTDDLWGEDLKEPIEAVRLSYIAENADKLEKLLDDKARIKQENQEASQKN